MAGGEEPGQNGGFWMSKMGVKHFGRSESNANHGFAVFGKSKSLSIIAKSIRDMCPVSLEQ